MTSVTMDIKGLETISRLLTEYPKNGEVALEAELFLEAQGIQTAATPLVPVDTGALRNSWAIETHSIKVPGPGRNNPLEDMPNPGEVFVGYGGPSAAYAWFVHEIPANHVVGTWKYLEIPFNHAKSGMAERVATGMDERLRRL